MDRTSSIKLVAAYWLPTSFIITFLLLTVVTTSAQNEIELRTDGIVIPRVDSATVASPTLGQVIYDTNTSALLYYNGALWKSIGGAFEKSGNLVRQKQGYASDDFVFGREAIPAAGFILDTLFFFDKSKGAFRGGQIFSNDWSPDSIGNGSFAFGSNTKASGLSSTAMGSFTKASGDISTAMGNSTTASGRRSTAMGNFGTAPGDASTAMGNITTASGNVSTAMGSSTTASGIVSTAMGNFTTASGGGSTAMGNLTTASGDVSTAIGYGTTATGDVCTAIGQYNDTIVTTGQDVIATSPLFIVGNGDFGDGNESNAVVVRKDGRVGISENDPDALLHLFSDTLGMETGLKITSTGVNQINSLMYHDVNGDLFLRKQAHADQLVLANTGKIGMGIIPLTNKLEVEGQASKTMAGAWIANSDRRIKTDIRELKNASEIVKQLRPVKFKYSDEWRARYPSIKDHYYYNFIAQDFQEIFPDAVQGSGEYLDNDDEEILQIDTYNAQIMTIAAVKELIKENDELRRENTQLKQRDNQFEKENVLFRKELNDLKSIVNQHIVKNLDASE